MDAAAAALALTADAFIALHWAAEEVNTAAAFLAAANSAAATDRVLFASWKARVATLNADASFSVAAGRVGAAAVVNVSFHLAPVTAFVPLAASHAHCAVRIAASAFFTLSVTAAGTAIPESRANSDAADISPAPASSPSVTIPDPRLDPDPESRCTWTVVCGGADPGGMLATDATVNLALAGPARAMPNGASAVTPTPDAAVVLEFRP